MGKGAGVLNTQKSVGMLPYLSLIKVKPLSDHRVDDSARAPPSATNGAGKKGERLDDIQHLVNKLLHQKLPDAPRVRVDVNHFRGQKDDQFLNDIRRLADKVRASGEPVTLDPMNSYQRRLVHNLFKDDPGIKTWSPEDDSRMKRLTLQPRQS